MFLSPQKKPARSRSMQKLVQASIEGLESRTLLSADCPVQAQPHASLRPLAQNGPPAGYSPQQIQHAYGFDQVQFGGARPDGRGQTIAIVDAFNDPNISGDLANFDKALNVSAPPSFKIVNQNGGVKLPATDAGWSQETSLDVEWAHAMAPAANLLLVEGNSASLGDLLTAVDTARKAPGVSTVSMSWGTYEFRGENAYDNYFTTPTGHSGVTFLSASGDEGSYYGAEWPSVAPSVVSVGGTSLAVSSSAGTYAGENGWAYSTGGVSQLEREPAFQRSVQNTGRRSTPDVAYDANPQTGFAVYDSVRYQGYAGWDVAGGTSAGAPQWAALVALANQGRSIKGLPALDGATGTLPALYGVYGNAAGQNGAAPQNASAVVTYAGAFNDTLINRGWSYGAAGAGYDTQTGLGSPKVPGIIRALGGIQNGTIATTPTPGPGSQSGRTLHPSILGERLEPAASSSSSPATAATLLPAATGRSAPSSLFSAVAIAARAASTIEAVDSATPAAHGTSDNVGRTPVSALTRTSAKVAINVVTALSSADSAAAGSSWIETAIAAVPRQIAMLEQTLSAGIRLVVSQNAAAGEEPETFVPSSAFPGRASLLSLGRLQESPVYWSGRAWRITAMASFAVAIVGFNYCRALSKERKIAVRA